MSNILLRITYDGTAYSGFQIQANAFTVQEALERALAVIYKRKLRIAGAGRTDAGVHARGQAAHYTAPFRIATENIPHALNAALPADIVVTGAMEVDAGFHARFDARGKRYSYTVDRACFPQVTKRLYSWHMPDPLDLERMEQACLIFEGTHDFKLFQGAGGTVEDTRRTIYRLALHDMSETDGLVLIFEGDGFLYRMVRLITGAIIRVGKGVLELDEIAKALQGVNRTAVGPSAPAHGLCLEEVNYDLPAWRPIVSNAGSQNGFRNSVS